MRIEPNLSGSNQRRQAGVFRPASLQPHEHGFSLLELLIVIVIIGIMGTLAIPAFADWRETQALRNASQTLMARLKQARVLAVSENRSVRITFSSNAYTFDDGSCSTCKNEQVPLKQFSKSLTITSNRDPLRFSSRGIATNATIAISSSVLPKNRNSKKIIVNTIGRVYSQ